MGVCERAREGEPIQPIESYVPAIRGSQPSTQVKFFDNQDFVRIPGIDRRVETQRKMYKESTTLKSIQPRKSVTEALGAEEPTRNRGARHQLVLVEITGRRSETDTMSAGLAFFGDKARSRKKRARAFERAADAPPTNPC